MSTRKEKKSSLLEEVKRVAELEQKLKEEEQRADEQRSGLRAQLGAMEDERNSAIRRAEQAEADLAGIRGRAMASVRSSLEDAMACENRAAEWKTRAEQAEAQLAKAENAVMVLTQTLNDRNKELAAEQNHSKGLAVELQRAHVDGRKIEEQRDSYKTLCEQEGKERAHWMAEASAYKERALMLDAALGKLTEEAQALNAKLFAANASIKSADRECDDARASLAATRKALDEEHEMLLQAQETKSNLHARIDYLEAALTKAGTVKHASPVKPAKSFTGPVTVGRRVTQELGPSGERSDAKLTLEWAPGIIEIVQRYDHDHAVDFVFSLSRWAAEKLRDTIGEAYDAVFYSTDIDCEEDDCEYEEDDHKEDESDDE